jgi:hypothetical protein
VSKFSLLLTKFSFGVPILAPEGPAKLSQGSPCLKIFDFLAGPFLRIFPVGGGTFFEKGPFCEIIY